MPEEAHCRVVLRRGPSYLAIGSAADVADLIFESDARVVSFMSDTGQTGFPPEKLFVRPKDVVAVQECSAEGWVWQQLASEKHYSQMVADFDPSKEQVAAMREMVAAMKGEDDDG